LSECALKAFSRRNPSKLTTSPAVVSNGYHHRMSVSVSRVFDLKCNLIATVFLWRGIVGGRWPSRPNFRASARERDVQKIAIGLAQSAFAGLVSSLASSRPLGGNGRSIAEINEN
jgi:hypothetical protein